MTLWPWLHDRNIQFWQLVTCQNVRPSCSCWGLIWWQWFIGHIDDADDDDGDHDDDDDWYPQPTSIAWARGPLYFSLSHIEINKITVPFHPIASYLIQLLEYMIPSDIEINCITVPFHLILFNPTAEIRDSLWQLHHCPFIQLLVYAIPPAAAL